MIIRKSRGRQPEIYHSARGAEIAAVIGEVTLGAFVTVWYGAVLRGDEGPIHIGDGSNIQDNCVLHCTAGMPVSVGRNVVVGHGAILHSCTVEDGCLIGMGAVVMDNAVIPDGTVVAAGAVVLENKVLEPGIWAGVPAKKVKDSSDRITGMAHDNAMHYIEYKEWYR